MKSLEAVRGSRMETLFIQNPTFKLAPFVRIDQQRSLINSHVVILHDTQGVRLQIALSGKNMGRFMLLFQPVQGWLGTSTTIRGIPLSPIAKRGWPNMSRQISTARTPPNGFGHACPTCGKMVGPLLHDICRELTRRALNRNHAKTRRNPTI